MSHLPHRKAPRLGPRPLPLHMAVETWITQLSFAGLTLSSGVLPPWKMPVPATLPNLLPRALAESQSHPQPDALDPAQLVTAVAAAAKARMESFMRGVARYHTAPPSDRLARPDAVWSQGNARLRFYGGQGAPVMVMPSLVNRADILDLSADRSFMRDLATGGLATYLLDWDAPGDVERNYASADYIMQVAIPALAHLHERHGVAAHLIGYCMGGTLAMAPAVLRADLVSRLALLAAPWDFHADSAGLRAQLPLLQPILDVIIGAKGEAPVDLLQALFALLDPTLVGRKFRSFAAMPEGEDAQRFVALEDWLNDGVPLAGPLAREGLFEWYGANTPGRGLWSVSGMRIEPARVRAPTLVVSPSQDRIVPPASARAAAKAIPHAQLREVSLGHIGIIAGAAARATVTQPLIDWLNAKDSPATP